MRGRLRSSAKRVAPVTLATASILRSAFPMTLCMLHPLRGELDRLVDLEVAGTAAEVSGECVLDLVSRRFRIGGEQRFSGQEEGGRAVATLRGAQVGERLLEWMELATPRHAFDGAHGLSRAGQTQHETREHRRSIQQHGARAAFSQLAAVLRAGESQVFAQDLEQRLMRRER